MKLEVGLNKCTNHEYHNDCNFYSSSDYKTLLKSPFEFYENKILKVAREEEESKDHFALGSLTHSLILEPHLVAEEYAVYPGMVRRGKEYEEFRKENPDRTIVTKSQNSKALAHQRAYKNAPLAVQLLQECESEFTIVAEWNGIPTKVRCDSINVNKGYIVDIKTSSFPVDPFSFKETVQRWQYDLSAALYAEIAAKHYGKPFDFYWICIQSADSEVQCYKMGHETRLKGFSKILKAAQVYKDCLKSGVWPKILGMEEKEQQAEILEI